VWVVRFRLNDALWRAGCVACVLLHVVGGVGRSCNVGESRRERSVCASEGKNVCRICAVFVNLKRHSVWKRSGRCRRCGRDGFLWRGERRELERFGFIGRGIVLVSSTDVRREWCMFFC
jgi:hypothetical protein